MIYILAFVLGTVFGSFFNVAFSRSDWYKGRSRCDSCGYTLKWYDLVPVVSYIALRGKCRKCGTKIDKQHLICECMTGTAFLCAAIAFSRTDLWTGLMYFCGIFFMSAASVQDIKERCVYSGILYAGIFLCLLFCLIPYIIDMEWENAIYKACTVIAAELVFWILSKFLSQKIGDGDFDLMLMMVIMFGIYKMVVALTIGNIIGCIVYGFLIITKKHDKNKPIAYAPILLLGTAVGMVI